ncbi:GGDEF domain-containing protein [Methylobacterium nonmethylotrophicum]|uniref:diguanylate cyclase n=1 Tax=Methylobacterium nonmethylotrophicum TaxID=1141884 RepID=A0A4Z0NVR8_9HYPH|nr:GGDEF domain-containing protein [Methylobacterium nonmethylotrophicum]TGE00593.1 GGDEF domain-containing protein [Methylobacterium nonmethylotrophicum]
MTEPTPSYRLPRAAPLRWLADPGLDLPAELRVRLLATLLSSVASLVLGAVAMLIIELVAVIRHPEPAFLCLLATDLCLLAFRLVLLRRSGRAVAEGRPAATDVLLASSLAWAGLIGAATVLCFASGDPVLQVLAPLTMMGILSGIVTRNYAAPRLAVAMIVLCDLPLKLMLPFHYGDAWFLIGTVQGLLFGVAMSATTVRLNRTYVEVLLARQEDQRRATHDPLTGLRNRTGLMEDLAARLQRGGDLALLYLDLDGFKAVNDCLGHAAGDALLVQVAGQIAATIPAEWQAARLGGDEFVILAAGARRREAGLVAARLIEAVKAPYDVGPAGQDGNGIGVGLSIGLAWALPGMSPDALLAEADAALYRAKAAGKGRCALAAEPPVLAARVA